MTCQSAPLTLCALPGCPEQTLRLLASRPQLDEVALAHLRPHLDALVFSALKSGELEAVLHLLRHVRAQLAA